MATLDNDTIAAVATGSGGGIGVVRISGTVAPLIAEKITHKKPKPRHAILSDFYNEKNELIDTGIVIFFPSPHSFTGEDVVELQGHGGAVVLDQLLSAILAWGARQARPGEFTERAFLNNKIDLIQAEAIADLINASSAEAARSATSSLHGAFSTEINRLIDALVALRVYVEAAMDFPEEEVDFLTEGKIAAQLSEIKELLANAIKGAHQGALLTEGITIVIAGRPNVGKSSLLNALSRRDSAIVTPIAGTTRDILREYIQIEGMPLQIIDTAGLRASDDPVEQEGVRRAKKEIEKADQILLVTDSNENSIVDIWPLEIMPIPESVPITVIKNKCDLMNLTPRIDGSNITLSAKTGGGVSLLVQHLKNIAGFADSGAGRFSARRRHLVALKGALAHINQGLSLLDQKNANELLAEELRLAQQEMEVITGRFAPDDLLEKIFRDFCIGK